MDLVGGNAGFRTNINTARTNVTTEALAEHLLVEGYPDRALPGNSETPLSAAEAINPPPETELTSYGGGFGSIWGVLSALALQSHP